MKKIMLTILSVFCFLFSVMAQEVNPRFSSINSVGFAAGQSMPDLVLQTVNGIRFSNWYTGIGIGVDNYRYKTLPLFIDGRRSLGKENEGFLYADLGYNFPYKDKPGKEISYYDNYHFTGGIYTDIGIGCQVKLNKIASFLFSLGYSSKELQTKTGVNICPFIGPCYVDYSKYDLNYGRIILKAGLVF